MGKGDLLLIAPTGIEIREAERLRKEIEQLLIAPTGIEIQKLQGFMP